MPRVAVVTGAGSGVGRAIVIALAERGWSVALLARRSETLEETIELSKPRDGAKLLAYPCDVSDEKAVFDVADRVKRDLGLAEALVNSAATNILKRDLEKLEIKGFREVMEINLVGAFLCVKAFLPAMRERGNGTIVNIISDAGMFANAKAGVPYVASKFGLRGLTQSVNCEQRDKGIRACSLCPGDIDTPLLDKRPVPPPAEARKKMLQAEDIARCALLAIELPPRAIIEEILVRPA